MSCLTRIVDCIQTYEIEQIINCIIVMTKLVRGVILAVFQVQLAASTQALPDSANSDISKDEGDRCEHLRGPLLGTNDGAGSAEGV